MFMTKPMGLVCYVPGHMGSALQDPKNRSFCPLILWSLIVFLELWGPPGIKHELKAHPEVISGHVGGPWKSLFVGWVVRSRM